MSKNEQQRLQHSTSSTSSPQASPIQTRYTPQEADDLLRKLQETTIEALRTSSNDMDSSNSYGGGGSSSKGTSPDDGSKSYDQPVIFDGLLPRIETRGQSKHASKKKSGKKKEDKSSSQQYVPSTDDKTTGANASHAR
ncbi:uncharacterized protein LY79DRAFT_165103 [Colletotrichum navitas]|uniref:Uncharacterized protein n=1 Tax=Colletotrichum navitas TaxID=681940 RepID=A0AAD8V6V3_9PEZI|nr:uncharacterized protein LY79DRAFT_165103 [Colletotrichum navitas]KAK1593961.1 hypothetical protein LY79DRAFT_165103 [Colletotrichum navitas]